MRSLGHDVRLAFRRLRLAPGFTIFAVLSLALGIGVSTAIYSAVRTLLWPPLGVPHEQTLATVTGSRARTRVMSWVDFEELRRQQTTASAVTAGIGLRTTLQASGSSLAVSGEAVSGDYFTVLGLKARAGRLLDPGDESAGASVAVLSERFWRTRLNGDPGIVGRSIRLGGQPFDVVGVAEGSFQGLEALQPSLVWVPATAVRRNPDVFAVGKASFDAHEYPGFTVWVRPRAGVSVGQIASEATVIGERLDAAYPSPVKGATRAWGAAPGLRDPIASESLRTIVIMIMTALVVVLLIACTNLANLSLARGSARTQETAVRTALGASRWRLVREQVVESALVVAAGAGGGLLVLFRLVDYFTTDLPMGRGALAFRPDVDTTVLAGAFVATVIALLVFGAWPALASTGADVRLRLGAGQAATPPKWRFHRNLIAWQVCGSVALLLVAVMSARVVIGTGTSLRTPPYRDVAIAEIDFRQHGISSERARTITEAILTTARRQAGVQRVAATNGSPSTFFGTPVNVGTSDDPAGARSSHTLTALASVTPAFLDTLGVGLSRGRGFSDRDDAAAPRVAIVTEQLARDLYRTTDVLGRELRVGGGETPGALEPATIVGVARDVTTFGSTRGDRIVFLPLSQHYEPRAPILIVARSSDAAAAVGTLRSVVRAVDPSIAISAAGTGDVMLSGGLFLLRVVALLAASLGGLALVLAMAGLFGVLSHVVERRTREIGIRLAIGADRRQVMRMILRDGLRPVAKGLVLGLVIGLGVRIAIRGQVYSTIAAWDPAEFTLIPFVFFAAALVACWLPAARASRVDPNIALRDL